MALCPAFFPDRQKWHSASRMPVCSIAPHSLGLPPRKGDGGKLWERGFEVCPAATFESLLLRREGPCRQLGASHLISLPPSLLAWGLSPRGPRQPPFPAQSSLGEALAVIMENCPAKKVIAGKAAEGENTGRGREWGGVGRMGKS